jgi:gamma-glutamylcyclotransferase
VPGRGYRPTWLNANDVEDNPVTAIAYLAKGMEIDGSPSHRYISLLREGARRHGLPEQWVQFLDSVSHAE